MNQSIIQQPTFKVAGFFLEEIIKAPFLETYVTGNTHEDDLWDKFLEGNVQGDLLNFFMNAIGATMREFNTRNIAYVDVFNLLCTIFRFIPISQHDRNITFSDYPTSSV